MQSKLKPQKIFFCDLNKIILSLAKKINVKILKKKKKNNEGEFSLPGIKMYYKTTVINNEICCLRREIEWRIQFRPQNILKFNL